MSSNREQLRALARSREPYYVPEGTTLNEQLLQFQRQRRRLAFVVDEYGDVLGLVTLEDLLEEIVGEFTSDTSTLHKDVLREPGGSFVVNAAASVRALNRRMGWTLPTSGPRTLNGLIVEYLETIPEPGTSLRLDDYAHRRPADGRERGQDRATAAPRADRAERPRRVGLRTRPSSAGLRARSTPVDRRCRRSRGAVRSPPARSRARKPCLAASRSRSSPKGTGRISPVSPSSPNATRSAGSGSSAQARRDREHRRQIRRGLVDPHAADDVDEHVETRGRDPAVPMQHREQQREPARIESHRDAARRDALCVVEQRLHLDQQRPAAFARHGHDAAGHRVGSPRQENRRRIAHFLEPLLGHREHADLVGGTEAVLDGADDAVAAAGIALEIEHRIDHVLEDARARDQPLLGDVADRGTPRRRVSFA